MKPNKISLAFLGLLLTFTSLGASTSTAFSQNLKELLVGDMKYIVLAKEPKVIKDFSFIDGNSKTHKISDHRGKVILLNFWATWCAPCRKEMPGIDTVQAEMAGDDFEVIALSIDTKGIERVKKFLKNLKIKNLAPYNDSTLKSGRAVGVFGLPATLLIDRQGREVGRMVGPTEWDSDESRALIQAIIDKP